MSVDEPRGVRYEDERYVAARMNERRLRVGGTTAARLRASISVTPSLAISQVAVLCRFPPLAKKIVYIHTDLDTRGYSHRFDLA